MDKKFLRNIKRPEATTEWVKMAILNEDMRYLINVHEAEDVLVMDFFERSSLKSGIRTATFRVFSDSTEFITQDLTTEKTKWLESKVEKLCGCPYWTYSSQYNKVGKPRHYDIVFASDRCETLMTDRYGGTTGGHTVWDRYITWQEGVGKRKLYEKHLMELRHTDYMMEMVPEVPEDFEQWAYETANREHRYLIFDAASSRRHRDAYCTHCNSYMKIDMKKMPVKIDMKCSCPECDSEVTVKSYKRWHDTEYTNKFGCLIQKVDGYIIARYFRINLYFDKGNLQESKGFKRDVGIVEECRIFYGTEGLKTSESFEFKQYKTMPGCRWCPDENTIDCTHAVVYTANLPEELADTQFKYSGIDAYQKNEGYHIIPIWNYMKYFPDNPELEYLAKTGLTQICSDLVTDTWRWRGNSRHNIDVGKIRRLNKQNLKILRSLNGSMYVMDFLLELQHWGTVMTSEEVDEFMTYLGARKDVIRKLAIIGMHPRKLVRYVRKQYLHRHDGKDRLSVQNRRDECKNICRDWEDYVSWCQDLEKNTEDEYVLMPPNLLQAHDRLLAEKKEKEDAIAKKKMEEETRLIQKIMEDSKNAEPLNMKTKHLMIVLPNGVSDLKFEGETLHHCVATYANRVAKGQTLILFIRQVEAPNTPFYTLEWKDHKVAQCRGMRNCDMTSEVRAFVRAFEKKMNEYERKKVG